MLGWQNLPAAHLGVVEADCRRQGAKGGFEYLTAWGALLSMQSRCKFLQEVADTLDVHRRMASNWLRINERKRERLDLRCTDRCPVTAYRSVCIPRGLSSGPQSNMNRPSSTLRSKRYQDDHSQRAWNRTIDFLRAYVTQTELFVM